MDIDELKSYIEKECYSTDAVSECKRSNADRQAMGAPIYMVRHYSEKNRWQISTKERFSYLKEYENRGDWEFMAVMAVTI